MPVGNQYGIDLGNVLSTVSDLKTAQQNQENNALRNQILQRQNDEDIASKQAEQDFMKDPATATAATIAQKIGWDKYTQEQKAVSVANMKANVNQQGIS